MDDFESAVATINEFLAAQPWCDFRVHVNGDAVVLGGLTGPARGPDVWDITVRLYDVVYVQLLTFWETEPGEVVFALADPEEHERLRAQR